LGKGWIDELDMKIGMEIIHSFFKNAKAKKAEMEFWKVIFKKAWVK
jgi:hypothetical protein